VRLNQCEFVLSLGSSRRKTRLGRYPSRGCHCEGLCPILLGLSPGGKRRPTLAYSRGSVDDFACVVHSESLFWVGCCCGPTTTIEVSV